MTTLRANRRPAPAARDGSDRAAEHSRMRETGDCTPTAGLHTPIIGRARALGLLLLCGLALQAVWSTPLRAAPLPQDEDEQLLEEERRNADRMRRRGDLRGALSLFGELLDDDEPDPRTRALRARALAEAGKWDRARNDAERAVEDWTGLARSAAEDEPRRVAVRILAHVLYELGEFEAALEAISAHEALWRPAEDARDAWVLGLLLDASGERSQAEAVWQQGANAPLEGSWEALLAKARCERRLGFLERASRSLVAADRAAQGDEGREPDVLVELAGLYFEADAEVDSDAAAGRSPGVYYNEALELNPDHEGALLGLFELHRHNWKRQSRPAHEILDDLLRPRPNSIRGQVAGCAADLEDGRLVAARERLQMLEELAPKRRDVRTLRATLAWIEHKRDECERILTELTEQAPADSAPEREVGRTLCELYRFAEGLPFLQRSVERNPSDWAAWTQLGRALANTGDEKKALEALQRSEELAAGRQDAWRHNSRMVLERMETAYTTRDDGELRYVWSPDAREVLETYLVPFYSMAREELSQRYSYTPDPVQIEVFSRHEDFSVRSTGFQGFPALGVCFGPVVTAVSPVSELRGTFSWARTSFHEFTHVVHLGLSHNRCPRWITEGLATWEEVRRNPTWSRNMRRELVDVFANDELIPVRDLNRAFRGPNILFGYYQGGLLCEMLVAEYTFTPMIRLLEAFDRGLDLDQAFREVFDKTPEEVDAAFAEFIAGKVADLHHEPRWSSHKLASLRLSVPREAPEEVEARAQWSEDLATLAWGHWQAGQTIDAEQALRRVRQAGLENARTWFLRGEMSLSRNEEEAAIAAWERGLEAGGNDYRVHMALARLAMNDKEWERAEAYLLAAEAAFPGYDIPGFSAELDLARVYAELDRQEDRMRARERWLAFNAGEYDLRVEVAAWHAENGRHADASRLYAEACEVDPFQRAMHLAWGESLEMLGRHEEAEREYRVSLLVPEALDTGAEGSLGSAERADIEARRARCFLALERGDDAAAAVERALELDSECALALELRGQLP